MAEHRYTLTLSCPDRVGIVAAVSGFVAQHGGFIVEASYHTDQETQRFFMRQEIRADSLPFDAAGLRTRFAALAEQFSMDWQVSDSAVKKRVAVLVSKQDHCLNDLLHRWRSGELEVEIPCVISNHEDLRGFVEWHGIPFHHVAMQDKAAAFAEIARQFDETRGDVMVLARFMQIMPPDLCARYAGRIINIHHSFLPSFAGAKPYHQAYHRGVKLIGATCHYATAELDAGPIIEQDTTRIDHGDTVEDMVRYGKDIEKTVLARGLRYHVEDRVLVCGNKTIVFR
ncbi:formyltetrahydrofolate deformylase [Candidatus Ferrigenium straubiae]|jgi:formyltetrahydrofolate deformylase|uniref:formyltetrahydrofolate deformylase n=1 Tax=Candidatus Ferrigenium straubiae TaxID=2919506 RepID=UPI003F4A8855